MELYLCSQNKGSNLQDLRAPTPRAAAPWKVHASGPQHGSGFGMTMGESPALFEEARLKARHGTFPETVKPHFPPPAALGNVPGTAALASAERSTSLSLSTATADQQPPGVSVQWPWTLPARRARSRSWKLLWELCHSRTKPKGQASCSQLQPPGLPNLLGSLSATCGPAATSVCRRSKQFIHRPHAPGVLPHPPPTLSLVQSSSDLPAHR